MKNELNDQIETEVDELQENIVTPTPRKNRANTRKIVTFAIFLAFVIVFQVFGGFFKIGTTSISLVLIPIVLGGALLGPLAGTLLGFAFGMVTLIAGVTGTDVFTAILFLEHPFLTVLICLGKGTLAGLLSALLYKLIARRNTLAAIFAASAAAPIVNTGLFILGALTMQDTLNANFISSGMSVMYFLVVVCAGVNFLIEFSVNMVASPAIFSLVKLYDKRRY